jgi:hypothetical protein
MTRELANTDPDVCRVIETLIDDRNCLHEVSGDGASRVGWHLDLGLDEDGRRQCEILPADFDGDGCPDTAAGPCECVEPYSGCLTGWFYSSVDEQCEHGQVRFTSSDVTSDLSDVRFECRTALCPQRRQCVGAALSGDACDPTAEGSCGGGRVCVRHNSFEICGDAGTCGRCTSLVGAECPAIQADNEYWADDPVVEAGGCCHEGFHCENNATCEANRTTDCGD